MAECASTPKVKGLCMMHYTRLRVHGDVTTVKQRGGVGVSDEIRDEIARAVRRFESPLSVAKRLGVSPGTVSRVMKASR